MATVTVVADTPNPQTLDAGWYAVELETPLNKDERVRIGSASGRGFYTFDAETSVDDMRVRLYLTGDGDTVFTPRNTSADVLIIVNLIE